MSLNILLITLSLAALSCEGDSEKTSGSDTVDETKNGLCLNSKCEYAKDKTYVFGVTKILKDDCEISDIEVFSNAHSFDVLSIQSCAGQSRQVYFQTYTLLGTAQGEPKLISSNCEDEDKSVLGFAADRNANNYLVSYTCGLRDDSNETRSVYTALVSINGQYLSSQEIWQTYSSDVKPTSVNWNEESGLFAVFGYEKRVLIDQAGLVSGGISASFREMPNIRLIDNHWYHIGISNYKNRCTKYHSSGTRLCNGEPLKGKYFVGDDHLIYEGSNRSVFLSLFNSESCTDQDKKELGNVEGFDIKAIYGAHQMSQDLGVMIYLNDQYSIAVSSFQLSGKSEFLAHTTVSSVGKDNLRDIKSQVKDGKLFIFFTSEGVLKMNVGQIIE